METQHSEAKSDLFVLAPTGEPVHPWITVEIDTLTRQIVSCTVSLDQPKSID